MVSIYSVVYQVSLTPNSDNYVIELTAPSNATFKVRAVRIMHGDGTATTSSDYHRKVKFVTESAAGSGGSSATIIQFNANSTAANVTAKTGLTTGGTVDKTVDVFSQHSSTDFWWQARDDDDKIVVKPSAFFAIVVNPAN